LVTLDVDERHQLYAADETIANQLLDTSVSRAVPLLGHCAATTQMIGGRMGFVIGLTLAAGAVLVLGAALAIILAKRVVLPRGEDGASPCCFR
jgi:hypothetical protein